MKKLVVTGPFNPAMRNAIEKRLPPEFQVTYIESKADYAALEDADYTILRTLDYNADDIARMRSMRLIQRWGVGFDTVDIAAAGKRGIPVAISYGINSTPVAEMALALTLACLRHVVNQTNNIMNGVWDRSCDKISYTISGKTCGVVGMGNIGRKVAALYRAFGAKVLYYDVYRMSAEAEASADVTFCELDALWEQCDIISLHAPSTDETREMINARSLAKMKTGAVLINTARAELVDEAALAEALRSGKLLAAGLDAINEDIVRSNPFSGLDNVVFTAHLGGNTADNVDLTAERAVSQILTVDRGGKLSAPACVNLQFL